MINWNLRNKLHCNFNQNTKIFINENASENIVCEMAAILSRGDELNTRISIKLFNLNLVKLHYSYIYIYTYIYIAIGCGTYRCAIVYFVANHLWRHQMETFFRVIGPCARNSPVNDAELWCFLRSAPINSWVNICKAGAFNTQSRSLWRHCNVLLTRSPCYKVNVCTEKCGVPTTM